MDVCLAHVECVRRRMDEWFMRECVHSQAYADDILGVVIGTDGWAGGYL